MSDMDFFECENILREIAMCFEEKYLVEEEKTFIGYFLWCCWLVIGNWHCCKCKLLSEWNEVHRGPLVYIYIN